SSGSAACGMPLASSSGYGGQWLTAPMTVPFSSSSQPRSGFSANMPARHRCSTVSGTVLRTGSASSHGSATAAYSSTRGVKTHLIGARRPVSGRPLVEVGRPLRVAVELRADEPPVRPARHRGGDAERPPQLLQQLVGLLVVAGRARGHAVLPGVLTPS